MPFILHFHLHRFSRPAHSTALPPLPFVARLFSHQRGDGQAVAALYERRKFESFATVTNRRYRRGTRGKNRLDNAICSGELNRMAKRKFVPIVPEEAQSRAPIHGRGAS